MSKFWPVFGHSSHVLFSKYIFCVSNQSSCSAISKKYSLKNRFMVLNKIQRFLLGLSRLYIQAQIIFEIEVPREEDSIILNLYQSSLCSTSIWTLGIFLWSRRNIIFKILADIRYVLGTANTFETPRILILYIFWSVCVGNPGTGPSWVPTTWGSLSPSGQSTIRTPRAGSSTSM